MAHNLPTFHDSQIQKLEEWLELIKLRETGEVEIALEGSQC
jgi:hypothetical protein